MIKIKDITHYLESIAPLDLQESYDNAGLLVGAPETIVNNVLITLDVTETVVQEAVDKGCNLIIAHHPIVFKGLKKLNGRSYVERVIIEAIKNDIALYAIHTNLDNVHMGVNKMIADKIGLTNTTILLPKRTTLMKLVTFVPSDKTDVVLDALNQAGAGQIGDYKNCSFRTAGIGAFEPEEDANPTIGEVGKRVEVNENRIEVILPAHKQYQVMNALVQAHPYEEVAYYLTKLENIDQETGAGMVGFLEEALDGLDFLMRLKTKMGLNVIRHTALLEKKVRKIAVCGGAGSFLLPEAIRQDADVFISSDFKYHEFFDAENKIVIADIGHYESEVFTKNLIYSLLNKKFTNIALTLSEKVTNPISYL